MGQGALQGVGAMAGQNVTPSQGLASVLRGTLDLAAGKVQ